MTPSALAVNKVEVVGNRLGLPHDLLEAARDDVGRGKRDHRVELTLLDQFHGFAAEAGGQHAVEAGRRAAALQVTEDDRSRFLAGLVMERLTDSRPHAAEPLGVASMRGFEQQRRPASWKRPFRHDDDAEMRPPSIALAQTLGDDGDVERNFRDQNRIGSAGDTGVQRDPPGVVAHHFHHHDAPVRFRGRVQAIDRVGGEVDGGVEPETVRGADDVVVDGLGTPTIGMPSLQNSCAIPSVPSPPMTTSASSPILWNISMTRSE